MTNEELEKEYAKAYKNGYRLKSMNRIYWEYP